jgi:hypothetical protein
MGRELAVVLVIGAGSSYALATRTANETEQASGKYTTVGGNFMPSVSCRNPPSKNPSSASEKTVSIPYDANGNQLTLRSEATVTTTTDGKTTVESVSYVDMIFVKE